MPAPPNTTFGTAIDIGTTFPVVISQRVDDGVTLYDVWYKYTAAADIVLGVFGHGDYVTNYQANVQLMEPDHFTIRAIGTDKPLQFSPIAGNTYYIKIAKAGNAIPANLTLEINPGPAQDIPIGSIYINDDSIRMPLTVISGVDGTVLRDFPHVPSGESGAVLNGGKVLIADERESQTFKLYSDQLVLLNTLSPTGIDIVPLGIVINSNKVNKFYVGTYHSSIDNHARVTTINSDGTLGATTWALPEQGLNGMAPSPDETILYFTGQNSAPKVIKRWDLVNNIALSDLAPSIGAAYETLDMLCLDDGSVLQLYFNGLTPFDTVVKRYDATGTILNTYTPGNNIDPADTPRMAYDVNNANFWVWLHGNDGTYNQSTFKKIRVSDGVVLSSFTTRMFEGGAYSGPPPTSVTYPTVQRFGHAASCPFMLLRVAITGSGPTGDLSGMYKIVYNSQKTNDTLYNNLVPTTVKIPDPLIHSALIGD